MIFEDFTLGEKVKHKLTSNEMVITRILFSGKPYDSVGECFVGIENEINGNDLNDKLVIMVRKLDDEGYETEKVVNYFMLAKLLNPK